MTVWGKVIGGMAGFALGGPLGALLGAFAGHAVDRMREDRSASVAGGDDSLGARQVAFTTAIIVLSAKMAKADGVVTRDEIAAFKSLFHIPPEEAPGVARLWDQARQEADGFEPYARQVASLFVHEPAVLEELLHALFRIAMADGVLHPKELEFLRTVAAIFGFDPHATERLRQAYVGPDEADPYEILGVTRESSNEVLRAAYRKLLRENHPDTLIAQGLPQEFIDLANDKMATINAAWDRIKKDRAMT